MLWLFGCMHVATGLVHVEDKQVQLETMRGRRWELVLNEESGPLRRLDDYTVEVKGVSAGGRLLVRDWRVVDSQMGGGSFVGTIVEWGAQLAIEDRNTGNTLVLESLSGEKLRPYLGKVVLLVGPVVGSQQVQVVAFQVLSD